MIQGWRVCRNDMSVTHALDLSAIVENRPGNTCFAWIIWVERNETLATGKEHSNQNFPGIKAGGIMRSLYDKHLSDEHIQVNSTEVVRTTCLGRNLQLELHRPEVRSGTFSTSNQPHNTGILVEPNTMHFY